MFGKKRWMAAVLAAVLTMGFTHPVMAATYTINSVSLKITSDIEVGSDYGDVEVTTNSSRYYIDEYYVTNRPNGEWKRGSKPKVKITLRTDSESDQFKSNFSKSNVTLSGVDATVSSVSRSSSKKLVVNVTLNSLTGSGDYDLSVYDVHWDENQGQGYWEEAVDAKRYEVKIYRGSSLQNSGTLTTTDTSYNFAGYITRSGTYSFKVRAIYNSSYKGEWTDSGEWYVDAETAREIKKLGTGTTPGSSSSSTSTTGGPGNNATGAWLKDNVGWWYCNADRSYTVNNWQYINNKWYYFNERGYMVTGWVLWKNLYYYCGPNGDMLTNTWTPDGYYVDGNGVWVQGYRR